MSGTNGWPGRTAARTLLKQNSGLMQRAGKRLSRR
jgi:hypothetical protein